MMISRRTLCAAAAAAPFATWPFAYAHAAGDGIELMQAQVQKRSDGIYLTAHWEFDLAITLIESLRRGIALYFVCAELSNIFQEWIQYLFLVLHNS